MPVWLQVLATIASVVMCVFAAVYFFDRYFKTRRAADLDSTLDRVKDQVPSTRQQVDLEHRLTVIEGKIEMLMELNELKGRLAAHVLRSPDSPDREAGGDE